MRLAARKTDAQQDSVSLAEIRARYIGARLPAQVAADMEALWLELDRTRFALAGQKGRADQLRDELTDLQGRYWRLTMKLPGGPV